MRCLRGGSERRQGVVGTIGGKVRLVGVGVVGLGLGRHVKGPCRSGGASALDPACVGTLRLGTRKRSRRLAGGPMGCRRRGLLSAMRFGACRGGLFSSSSWAVHVLVRGLSGALRGRSAVARRRSASSGPTLFHPAFVSVFVRAFITVFGCIWCTVSLRRLHHLLSWFAPFPAPFAPFPAPFAPFPLRGQLAQWTVRAGKHRSRGAVQQLLCGLKIFHQGVVVWPVVEACRIGVHPIVESRGQHRVLCARKEFVSILAEPRGKLQNVGVRLLRLALPSLLSPEPTLLLQLGDDGLCGPHTHSRALC